METESRTLYPTRLDGGKPCRSYPRSVLRGARSCRTRHAPQDLERCAASLSSDGVLMAGEYPGWQSVSGVPLVLGRRTSDG